MARRSSEQWAQRVELRESVDVDVLLPTCNRPAELGVTLAGLAAQAEPSFAVVIIVVIAEVFREGARLRRESELTI